MQWSIEAEEAVAKVPFFVRRRVRKKVEEEALRCGAQRVEIAHVNACRQRYLSHMEEDVKGYQLETCFGSSGCPNRVQQSDKLISHLENSLASRDLRGFLKKKVNGPLKFHHEFRISVSDCPNACSRPQIVDIGIIGAIRPAVTGETCTGCGACIAACAECALRCSPNSEGPIIHYENCVQCGQCIKACPTGTLVMEIQGWRILVGGKLGRHPRLGEELPGLFTDEQVILFVQHGLDYYQAYNQRGERLGEMLACSQNPSLLASYTTTLSRKDGHDNRLKGANNR